MGKRVKWVTENLGVTRSALRVYEEKGLLPENEGGRYREYDEEGLHQIWTIKELQGLGYTLGEIAAMLDDPEFDFHGAMTVKVRELEAKRSKLDSLISYAKMVRMIGRIPSVGEIGSETFQQHHDRVMSEFNTSDLPKGLEEFLDEIANGLDGADENTMLRSLLEMAANVEERPEDREYTMSFTVYEGELARRSDRATTDEEVQLILKLFYEAMRRHAAVRGDDLSTGMFANLLEMSYQDGDVGKLNKDKLGEDVCEFIVQAAEEFRRQHEEAS